MTLVFQPKPLLPPKAIEIQYALVREWREDGPDISNWVGPKVWVYGNCSAMEPHTPLPLTVRDWLDALPARRVVFMHRESYYTNLDNREIHAQSSIEQRKIRDNSGKEVFVETRLPRHIRSRIRQMLTNDPNKEFAAFRAGTLDLKLNADEQEMINKLSDEMVEEILNG